MQREIKIMERVKGIEPSYSAWEAAALPLSYTRIFGLGMCQSCVRQATFSALKHLFKGNAQLVDDFVNMRIAQDERRGQQDVITVDPVNAAPHRITD